MCVYREREREWITNFPIQKNFDYLFTDHEVEVETAGVRDLVPAVGRVAATEIAGVRTAAAVVALVRIARARVASHARVASLRTGRKTVVPNPGENYLD